MSKTIYTAMSKTEKNIGHTNTGTSASGGYKKLGQLAINGVVRVYLFGRDTGVVADGLVGDVNTMKDTFVNHEDAKVIAYKEDIKSLNKILKKAKKADKADLKREIASKKSTLVYYQDKLVKARKL